MKFRFEDVVGGMRESSFGLVVTQNRSCLFSKLQKRVAVRKHRYFFGPVGSSVFSLAIALPQPYGVHGVDAQFELSNPANQKIDGKTFEAETHLKCTNQTTWFQVFSFGMTVMLKCDRKLM